MNWLRTGLIILFVGLNFGATESKFERENRNVDRLVYRMQGAQDLTIQTPIAVTEQTAYGRALFRRLKSLPDSFFACLKVGAHNCWSGALIEYVKQEKIRKISDLDFTEKLEETVCLSDSLEEFFQERATRKCYFHLGHALVELTSSNLKKALGLCDNLSDKRGSPVCVAGVYRRWFEMNLPSRMENEKFDLLPCGPRTRYLYLCVKSKVALATELWDQVAANYDHYCEGFGERSYECHRAIGASLFFTQWKSEQMPGIEVCRQGASENQDNCVKGAIDELLNRKDSLTEALKLCDRLGEEGKRAELCRTTLESGVPNG